MSKDIFAKETVSHEKDEPLRIGKRDPDGQESLEVGEESEIEKVKRGQSDSKRELNEDNLHEEPEPIASKILQKQLSISPLSLVNDKSELHGLKGDKN